MAQPGHLQVRVGSPFREQRGDADQMLVQASAGVGHPPGPAAQQELLDPAWFGPHVTSYTRDVKSLATPGSGPAEEELRFIFRSGRLCLAFCATVGERWRRSFERLITPAHLTRWYAEAAVASDAVPVTPADLEDSAGSARSDLPRRPGAHRRAAASCADEEIINRQRHHPRPATHAPARRALAASGPDPASSALSAIARDAISLFTTADARRLRECASPECGLLFLDTSRPGRRRWCSSTACGGKARAAAYRQRRQPPAETR